MTPLALQIANLVDAGLQAREAEVARLEARIAELERERDLWRVDYHRKDVHHQACVTQRDTARARVAQLEQLLAESRRQHG